MNASDDEQAGPGPYEDLEDRPLETQAVEDDAREPAATVDPDDLARAREAAAGHPGLEDALRRLDGLRDLDLDQHPAELEAAHRALREALSDHGAAGTDPVEPGDEPDST